MERYYKERDEEHKKDQARFIEENKKLKRLIDENQAKLLKCLINDNDSDTVNKDNKKQTKTKNKSINMDGDIVSPIEEAVLTATSQNPIHRQRMFDNQYSQFEYERNMMPQNVNPHRQFAPSDQVYGEHSNFYPLLQRSPHSMYFQQYGNDRSSKRDVMLGFFMALNS